MSEAEAQIGEQAPPEAEKAEPAAAEEPSQAKAQEVETPAEGEEGSTPAETGKKPGAERRIGQLVGENKDLRGALETTQTELTALRDAMAEGSTDELPAPKEDDFDNYDDYRAAEKKYYTSLGEQGAAKKLLSAVNKSQQEAGKAAQQRRMASFATRANAFMEQADDFEQTFTSVMNAGLLKNPVLAEGILESEVGPAVIYHLAKQPEKLMELNRMTPLQLGRELASLESSLSAPVKTEISEVPEPISDVGGSGVVRQKKPEDMSDQEYFNRDGKYKPLR